MGRKFPTKAKKIARIEKHPQELKENYKAIIEQLNFKPSSEIRKIYEAGQDSSGNKFDTHTKRTLASMIRRRERVENASKVPYFKNILTSLNVIVNPEDNSRSYTWNGKKSEYIEMCRAIESQYNLPKGKGSPILYAAIEAYLIGWCKRQ